MSENEAVNVEPIEGAQDEISRASGQPTDLADVTSAPCGQDGLHVGSITAPSDDLHPQAPGHLRNGRFARQNEAAMRHGGRRRQPVLNPEGTALYASWANDLGGPAELTAAERTLLTRAVEADAIAAGAISYLRRSHQSLVNPRVQSALTVWSQATGQLLAITRTLGLRRRAKLVDPLDAIRAAVEQANAR